MGNEQDDIVREQFVPVGSYQCGIYTGAGPYPVCGVPALFEVRALEDDSHVGYVCRAHAARFSRRIIHAIPAVEAATLRPAQEEAHAEQGQGTDAGHDPASRGPELPDLSPEEGHGSGGSDLGPLSYEPPAPGPLANVVHSTFRLIQFDTDIGPSGWSVLAGLGLHNLAYHVSADGMIPQYSGKLLFVAKFTADHRLITPTMPEVAESIAWVVQLLTQVGFNALDQAIENVHALDYVLGGEAAIGRKDSIDDVIEAVRREMYKAWGDGRQGSFSVFWEKALRNYLERIGAPA